MTVVRYVEPGSVALSAGTLFVSTVACLPREGTPGIGILGPAETILVRPAGQDPATLQAGSGPGCGEADGDYVMTSPSTRMSNSAIRPRPVSVST